MAAGVSDPRLDRRLRFDERSRDFPIRDVLPDRPLRSRSWPCYAVLDQSVQPGDPPGYQGGGCVGHGWAGELAAQPAVVLGVDHPYAMRIYGIAQTLDGFPDTEDGSSVLAGAQAVQQLGKLEEYRWAFGIDDVIDTLSHHGPVVLGIPWMDSMFDPAPNGLLDTSGGFAGGHCLLARGVLLKGIRGVPDTLVRLRQSWGEWGVAGDAFIRAADLESLLKNQGEACVPVRRRK